ncbi:phenolphthiocerol/phthiocerol polyketide synthase subunit C-like [Mercenaria mercenaria]|uniref:phenolphthiocerol/phthiocerol polyketide synthase subunit C-like n=1 Tax=Mercenaria mercenaria TaxID=6596 RepID=UPI00234F7338|nr:phenolphthiocerol/phthiocerol polyketide synthase subunit C-like [Mercenaria mercenaria]
MADNDEIAIIGIGCRFPGADNVKEFWRVLSNGENHVKEVPPDRWKLDAFYDADPNAPGKTYVRTAGFVKGVEEWDHRFFGINDMEAKLVDPQQRLVLECVHMALEDGGITRKDIDGSDTGVYIGSMTDDYKGHVMDDVGLSSAYSVTGTHSSIISARVSYIYNLLGPSLTLDTACSSSLVAIDLASQAILTGTCNMAVCGGVNVLLDPQMFIALSKARMLSPSGQCKTFTNEADGYARGEGCGIVILKKLKHAIADGNKIWSIIKTGTNQDGHMTTPITAPSGLQQERLIQQTYKRYHVETSKIQVIEAHGTGTRIGDPTEVSALGAHFGKKGHARSPVFIGSVKTNIGHLEASAGVAGLIKVLLMMENEMIVPSLWYRNHNENPKLKMSDHGFIVPTKCMKWSKSQSEKRFACVNSFGFGGTNAHAIVEEYQEMAPSKSNTEQLHTLPYIVAVSAVDKPTLKENMQYIHEALRSRPYSLPALSCTSTCKRDHKQLRKAVFGKTQEEMILAFNKALSFFESSSPPSPESKKIVFVFCGVGTSWKGMCNSLMKLKPFQTTICKIDEILQPLTGWKIADIFLDSTDIQADPMMAHIAIFSCQVGLSALWKHFGVTPDAVVGQSVGEVAAAFVSNSFDLETAVRIIYHRSKLLASVKQGSMAVVNNVKIDLVEKSCKTFGCVIAVYNSPVSCTVSGEKENLNKLKYQLLSTSNNGAKVINLDVPCAYHSPYVEKAANRLTGELEDISIQEGNIQVFSTVTGKMEPSSTFGKPEYWEKNVKMPVLFSRAVQSAGSKTSRGIFVEIGPSPVLHAHIGSILNENYSIIPSMKRHEEISTMTRSICILYEQGVDINWKGIFPCQTQHTDIPMYNLHKRRQFYQSPNAVMRIQGIDVPNEDHLYVKRLPVKDDNAKFRIEISETSTPFVFQHIVKKNVVIPGATYADIGFEIGNSIICLSVPETIVSLEFLRPVKVERGVKTTLDISTVTQKDEILFHVKQNDLTMCKGWVHSAQKEDDFEKTVDVEHIKTSVSNTECRTIDEEEMYGYLKSLGFEYGPCFQLMKSCLTNGTECITEIELPSDIMKDLGSTTIHPCILDVMVQSTINTTTGELFDKIMTEKLSFLPVAMGRIHITKKPEKKMYIYTKRINTTLLDAVFQLHYNVLLINSEGVIIADLRNYTTYGKRNGLTAPCELKYQLTWKNLELPLRSENSDANILVLTNEFKDGIQADFERYKNVLLYQTTHRTTNELYVEKAFKYALSHWDSGNNIDAVLLLIHTYEASSVTHVMATEIHTLIKGNCMLLSSVVKYMTNNSIEVPLYVVSQNTQTSFSVNVQTISLVGEELWGFVRSVNTELIHGSITLIDLQPSLKETKDLLVKFITSSCANIEAVNPEIVIHKNQIFGAQFTKVPRKEVIPTLRNEKSVFQKSGSSHKVLAKRSKRMQPLYLSDSTKTERQPEKESVLFRLKSVCVHPVCIYPRTLSGIDLDQDIWEETLRDGHELFGFEYTGYQVLKSRKGNYSCREPKTLTENENDFSNRWEIVCIYPSELSTEMYIPEDCTVLQKDIPMYKPGLLMYAVLCWRMTEYVPSRSRVVICNHHEPTSPNMMLKYMLQTHKNCTIYSGNESEGTGKDFDIFISVDKLDPSFVAIGKCKKIVCLEDCISESLRLKVSRSKSQTMICLSAATLLERRYVSKYLRKIVNWMQKNNNWITSKFQFSGSDHSTMDEKCCIPCPTVNIMRDGRFLLPVRNPLNKLFIKSAAYIVTGGMTGLGWELTVLLAEMGAGIIASLSRRKVPDEKIVEVENVKRTTGCEIICIRADVTNFQSVENAISEIECLSHGNEIRGVFHCAGVLEGKLLSQLQESQVDYVLRPKVIGTMNLHIATMKHDLHYFVVSSSINSIIGSPGQSSYGAANCFLDTFMEWRRKLGLTGQAINWGALAIGMAARPEFVENFEKRGFNLLSVPDMRSCFQEALMCNSTNIIYTDVNWNMHAKDYENPYMKRFRLRMSVFFEQAVTEIKRDSNEADNLYIDVKALQSADRENQTNAITQVVLKITGKVIWRDFNQLKTSTTLAELSLDSMSTVTFINIVQDVTGHRIPPSFMLDTNRTLDDVIHLLLENILNGKGTSGKKETNENSTHM